MLTHGWPGSFLEFEQVVGAAHRSPMRTAATRPTPSTSCARRCPGYGFSDRPAAPGWGIERIAAAWDTLMGRLGYDRYGAAGSDWGTSVSTLLAAHVPERVVGIHLVPPLVAPDPATFDDLTASERAALDDLAESERWESGYAAQQATRPQTLGYGLADSPVGQCAWIVEKLRAWSDNDGLPRERHPPRPHPRPRDALLADRHGHVVGPPLPGELRHRAALVHRRRPRGGRRAHGVLDLPEGDAPSLPSLGRAQRFPDIRHWHELDRGGHFAALEQPALFVDELRSFFRLVR